jgi:RNA polymerase sigma-70 factor (ECF subfamily)
MKSQPLPADYKKLPDEELIFRYVHRQEHVAMSYIYERYAHLVLGICLKYAKQADVANNLLVQLFIKLLEDVKYNEIHDFKAWLFQYTKDFCAAEANAQNNSVNNHISTKIGTEFVLHNNEWFRQLEEEHRTEKMADALNQLKPEYRLCIELFYLQKMNYDQIAKKTNYKVTQVRSYIQKGRKELKTILEAMK